MDDQFHIELESLRIKLVGQTFYDHESDTTIIIKGLNMNNYQDLFEYNDNVSNVYYRFKESHEEIILSLKLLELFDLSELRKNNIKKSQYLKNHLKFWHIKLGTTLDLAIKLVGNVYDLRISDKFMDFKIVENNKYIKSSPRTIPCLKQLKTLAESNIRNNIIHHQQFDNDLLSELSLSDLFNMEIKFGDEVENDLNIHLMIKEYYIKSEEFTTSLNSFIQLIVPVFKDYCEKKEFRN